MSLQAEYARFIPKAGRHYAKLCGLHQDSDWHTRLLSQVEGPLFCPKLGNPTEEERRIEEDADVLVFAITPRQPPYHTLNEISIAVCSEAHRKRDRLIVLLLLSDDDGVTFDEVRRMPLKNDRSQFQHWPRVKVFEDMALAAQFLNDDLNPSPEKRRATKSKEQAERNRLLAQMR